MKANIEQLAVLCDLITKENTAQQEILDTLLRDKEKIKAVFISLDDFVQKTGEAITTLADEVMVLQAQIDRLNYTTDRLERTLGPRRVK